MPLHVDDRYLWLGFGVCMFFAAKAARYAITDTVRLIELEPQQQDNSTKSERPEDSISLETLRTLASSPNSGIADSAKSLIVSRFARLPNAYSILSKDAYSHDETTKLLARQAIAFLRDWPSSTDAKDSEGLDADTLPAFSLAEQDFEEFEEFDQPTQSSEIPSVDNPIAGWTSVPRERPAGTNEVEREVRRRRREAMVLHEGDGSVNADDIFRPSGD